MMVFESHDRLAIHCNDRESHPNQCFWIWNQPGKITHHRMYRVVVTALQWPGLQAEYSWCSPCQKDVNLSPFEHVLFSNPYHIAAGRIMRRLYQFDKGVYRI